MKKKYYFLAFTFLFLLIGQSSFAQITGGDQDNDSGLGEDGYYDGSGESWEDEYGRLWAEDSEGRIYADINEDGILDRDEVISYDNSESTDTGSSEGNTNNGSGSFFGWGGGTSGGSTTGDSDENCWYCNTNNDGSNGGSNNGNIETNPNGSGGTQNTEYPEDTVTVIPGGTGANTSVYTGGGPNLVKAIPKTQQQFDDWIEGSKPYYNIVEKPGQIFTTSDGVKHVGTLTKIESTSGSMEYYFTPTTPETRFKTGYYYRIPDPKSPSAPSYATDYITRANYIYDSQLFPIGGTGYIIQNNGLPTPITMSPNNEPVEYIYTSTLGIVPSSIIGPEFSNSLTITPLSLTFKYKTENSQEVVASIAKHMNDMSFLDATRLVYYYNTTVNVNPSYPVNPSTIKGAVSSFYSSNGAVSKSAQEFIDWLASVAAIQMSITSDNFKIEGSESYDSTFEEDDDFAEAAQTDPFFANNPDDPWRLKQYLSPDDTYLLGVAAGLGDGFIETADLAYTLTKYGIKNSGPVLLFHLITDTKNTVQQQIDKIQVVKGLVTIIYDKTKQEQIFNAIQSFVGNWFDEITFQKTNVQAGYQHGKIIFEVLGALVGVEELKLLLKTGEFSTNALRIVNKLDNAFTSGRKFRNIDGVPHLLDEIGNPISHGDDIARVTENLADPVNDVQRTLRDQYESIVDDFEETIGDFSNKIKGNYGEIATDVKLSEKGYIPLHTRIDDINAAGHNGIDGVFEKDGQYFIVESKFSKTTTPSLNPANTSTGLPKQMSKDWIERGTELGDAIGDHNLANDIIDAGYTSVLATHGPNGNVVYKLVDSAGNIGSVWTP